MESVDIPPNPILSELEERDPSVLSVLQQRDGASLLLKRLPEKYSPVQTAKPDGSHRVWELVGLYYLKAGRLHEAIGIFWGLYQHLLAAQTNGIRVHKGMPLVWMSDCYGRLGFPVHAKRYLMLTLCEDGLREEGKVSPETTGIYFRLVWGHGLPDPELRRYAARFFELATEMPEEALFPEALLQRVDDRWMTEIPSPSEASVYFVNQYYVRHLLARLGHSRGEALEILAEYLLSSMPGCRTKRRQRSGSTEYDLVCAMEGFEVDFRSEFGRYFVCECKDWESPADFTTMAKFCRVLDSTKARFGILFSKAGVSGAGQTKFAEREQLKVFQDRGIVIVVLNLDDLENVASGANLIQILRERYVAVRLDLHSSLDVG